MDRQSYRWTNKWMDRQTDIILTGTSAGDQEVGVLGEEFALGLVTDGQTDGRTDRHRWTDIILTD